MSDFLPDEVVDEILSRLPVKSLIRFRCVSKPWNSLITSPIFINSHLNQSSLDSKNNKKNNLPLVIVRQCESQHNDKIEHYKLFLDTEDAFEEYRELEFPLKSRRLHFYWLMGCAKGLFCLFEQDHYYLWNPSIRKSLLLPKPCITKKTHGRFVDIGYGFGFDPLSNDYKVVRLPLLCRDDTRKEEAKVPLVVIYSLNAGSWRINSAASDTFPQPSEYCPSGFTMNFESGAYFKGAVHFVAESRRDFSQVVRMLLSFDLGNEVFQNMVLPDYMASRGTKVATSVLGGLLSLLCYKKAEDGNDSCSIWRMKEYGVVDSWCKQVTVDLTGGITKVLGIRNNGHILLEAKSNYPWELSSYDPSSRQLKKLGIQGRTGDFHVDNYEENLILVNKTNDPTSRWGATRKRKDRNDITPSVSRALSDEFKKQVDDIRARIALLKSQVMGADGYRQVVPRSDVNRADTGPSQSSEASVSRSAEVNLQVRNAMTDDEVMKQIDEINAQIDFLESLSAGADDSRQVPGIKGVRGR